MKIEINAKDIELNGDIRDKIVNKLSKIDRLLADFDEDIKTATIRLQHGSRWGYKINFSMLLPKKEHIFAEVKRENLDAALTELREEVISQIKDYKGKLQQYRTKNGQ